MDIDFQLSDRQALALIDDNQFLLYGGAKGGGKSWFLSVWMFNELFKYKGNKLFFFRKRAVDFINTTLVTWKKVIPASLYTINENKRKIFVPKCNGEIDFGGLDDEMVVEKLNSAEYGGGAIDQAEEVGRHAFGMCRGTLRHRMAGGELPSYKIRLSANPAQCWLKDDFILSPKENFNYVKALPTDNPYLPDSYISNLREAFEHRPELLEAYLSGSWDGLAGADMCIKSKNIELAKGIEKYGTVIKRIITCDPARFGDDETVIYVMEATERHYYIKEEHFLTHKSTMDTAGRLTALRKLHKASQILVDEIGVGGGVVDALNEMGEPVRGITSSNKPTNVKAQEKYTNLRAQMWMDAGDLFSRQVCILSGDRILAGQLGSVGFDYAPNGRFKAVSKKEIKEKLGRSPDRADAYVMGLYGLETCETLSHKEYIDASEDRQGHGKEVGSQDIDQYNYSGY